MSNSEIQIEGKAMQEVKELFRKGQLANEALG